VGHILALLDDDLIFLIFVCGKQEQIAVRAAFYADGGEGIGDGVVDCMDIVSLPLVGKERVQGERENAKDGAEYHTAACDDQKDRG
jgi:hypothetical protein